MPGSADPVPAPRPAEQIDVLPLSAAFIPAAAALHLAEFGEQFISRFGAGFLRRYYRAYAASPYALALVAVDRADGAVAGLLLGALDPPNHYRAIVRRHGLRLGISMTLGALRRPTLAAELVRTRARRYARGVARTVTPPAGAAPLAPPARVGEITHLLVHAPYREHGIGRRLVHAAERRAAEAGLEELVLVTPLDAVGAQTFYERLGWLRHGEVTSRSSERFVRYRRPIG